MIDPTLKALMNEALDGALDEAHQHELQRKLAAQPDAQAFFDDLLRVKAMLGEVPIVDPPEYLRAGVMRAVELEANNHVPAKPRRPRAGWRRLLPGPAPRLGWSHALVFAAGLIVGLLAILDRPGLPGSGQDNGALTGTLTPHRAGDEPVEVAPQEIALGPVRGRAQVSRAAGRLILNLDLASVGETDLSLEFDREAYRLVGFERDDEGAGEVETTAGRVQVARFVTGQLRVILEEEPPLNHPSLRLIARKGTDSFQQAIEVRANSR